jgi:hypothetical protein
VGSVDGCRDVGTGILPQQHHVVIMLLQQHHVVIMLQLKQHEELLVTAAALLNLQRVVLSGVSRVADGYRAWRVRGGA